MNILCDELDSPLYYVSLWLLHNNYVLQMYSHAATIAFM